MGVNLRPIVISNRISLNQILELFLQLSVLKKIMLEYSDIIEKELFEFLIDDKGFSDTHVKTVKIELRKCT